MKKKGLKLTLYNNILSTLFENYGMVELFVKYIETFTVIPQQLAPVRKKTIIYKQNFLLGEFEMKNFKREGFQVKDI